MEIQGLPKTENSPDQKDDQISKVFGGPPRPDSVEGNGGRPASKSDERVKSSTRLQYEAQVRVIRQQIGSLEKVRSDLGLSQRKIAQLLLVDPSAWTRWNRPGEEAPPHIWRSLQWYLTVREKIPGLTPQYFLGGDSRSYKEERDQRLQKAEMELQTLKAQAKSLRRWNLFWAGCALLLGLIFLILRSRS